MNWKFWKKPKKTFFKLKVSFISGASPIIRIFECESPQETQKVLACIRALYIDPIKIQEKNSSDYYFLPQVSFRKDDYESIVARHLYKPNYE